MRVHLFRPQVAQVVTQWEKNARSCHRHTPEAGQPDHLCPRAGQGLWKTASLEGGRNRGQLMAWGLCSYSQPTNLTHTALGLLTPLSLGDSSSSGFLDGSLSPWLNGEKRELYDWFSKFWGIGGWRNGVVSSFRSLGEGGPDSCHTECSHAYMCNILGPIPRDKKIKIKTIQISKFIVKQN